MSFCFSNVLSSMLMSNMKVNFYYFFIQGLGLIVRREGYRGLFRGLGPSLGQVAPLTGIQFMCFNLICDGIRKIFKMTREEPISVIELLIAGCVAGVVSKTITYPLDLAKKRLQIQGFSEHRRTFGQHFVCHNMYTCLRNTVVSEGLKGRHFNSLAHEPFLKKLLYL